MSNTLNKTLYDVYTVVLITKSDKCKNTLSIKDFYNTRLSLYDGIAYVNKVPVGFIPKADSLDIYERAEDDFKVLADNETFNPGLNDCVLLSQDDLSRLWPAGKASGTICYVGKDYTIIKLTTQISEVQVDNLFNEIVGKGNDSFELVDELFIITTEEKVQEKKVKEEKTMNNLFGNLGFGKLKSDRFKLSMNGIAVAQGASGKYVVYNKENNEFVDVTEMLFDIKDALFSLPTVEVAVGDVILHNDKPYFIVDITDEIKAVSYEDCTQTVLIPKTTMFGLKYFTKIFSMFGDIAKSGEIFSNPMMLMTLMGGEGSGDLSKMLMLSALTKGDLGTNPMMLAMMLKGDDDKSDLSTLAMMSMMTGGTNPFAPAKTARNLNKNAQATKETKE